MAATALTVPGTEVAAQSTATVFTVTSATDGSGSCAPGSGNCTLRSAITAANAVTDGPVRIEFAIGGASRDTGVKTIQITSDMPNIRNSNGTAGITIDGFTQPGSRPNTSDTADNAVRRIELIGQGPGGIEGLAINGQYVTIRGLSMHGFKYAIRISATNADGVRAFPARRNRIVGNVIGLDPAGNFDPAYTGNNRPDNPCVLVLAGAQVNQIGAPGNANRNTISGCFEKGIAFYNQFTGNNVVQNNIIGLDPTGTQLRPNFIGVDLNFSTNGTLIGGTGDGERNVISGNRYSAIEISHGTGTVNNRVVGNWIGTNLSGTGVAPSGAAGFAGPHEIAAVRLEGRAECDTDGDGDTDNDDRRCGLDASRSTVEGNVIVGAKGSGILVDKGFHRSIVRNNRIGVLPNGAVAPNGNAGIRLAGGAQSITIGPANTIAGSDIGVRITPSSIQPVGAPLSNTSFNTITQNSIRTTGGLGIELDPLGSDRYTLANEGVAAPRLSSNGSGSVEARTCAGCTVEVFRATGNGSGVAYLATATANGSGVAVFQQPSGGWPASITATTTTQPGTDANGNETKGSTSQFASTIDPRATNAPPPEPPPPLNPDGDPDPGEIDPPPDPNDPNPMPNPPPPGGGGGGGGVGLGGADEQADRRGNQFQV